jgi:hypothetical protein
MRLYASLGNDLAKGKAAKPVGLRLFCAESLFIELAGNLLLLLHHTLNLVQ